MNLKSLAFALMGLGRPALNVTVKQPRSVPLAVLPATNPKARGKQKRFRKFQNKTILRTFAFREKFHIKPTPSRSAARRFAKKAGLALEA